MRTETLYVLHVFSFQACMGVKLNDPLMGTET